MTLVLGVKLENKVLSSKAGQTRPAYRLIAANRVWSQGRTSGRALNWPGPPRERKENMVHLGNPGLGQSGPQRLEIGWSEDEW
jgi:hypothetical protein